MVKSTSGGASKPPIAGWQRSHACYWGGKPDGVKHCLTTANRKRAEHHYRHRSPAISEQDYFSSVEGAWKPILNTSETRQQLSDVAGKIKIIEGWDSTFTNRQTKALERNQIRSGFSKVASQLSDELGYSLTGPAGAVRERTGFRVGHPLSTIDATSGILSDIRLRGLYYGSLRT